MDCEAARDLLPLYAGGEIDPEERMAVEAHLGICTSCAFELSLYQQDRARLAELRDEEVPVGTWKALREDVQAKLFPRRRATRLAATLLRYAAILLFGTSIGLAIHVLERPSVPPEEAGRVQDVPVMPATFPTPQPEPEFDRPLPRGATKDRK